MVAICGVRVRVLVEIVRCRSSLESGFIRRG